MKQSEPSKLAIFGDFGFSNCSHSPQGHTHGYWVGCVNFRGPTPSNDIKKIWFQKNHGKIHVPLNGLLPVKSESAGGFSNCPKNVPKTILDY